MNPSNAAATAEPNFPQFNTLPHEIRRRIWGHFCPELQVPVRVLSFSLEPSQEASADPEADFCFCDEEELKSQVRQVTILLAVHRESHDLVKEVLPDTIDFKHFSRINDGQDDERVTSVVDGRVYFRKETDIIWLDMPTQVEDDCMFPTNLNSLQMGQGAEEALHVGFDLFDGRFTLWNMDRSEFATQVLQKFPKLQKFYYGISLENSPSRYHYMHWCFSSSTKCHEYAYQFDEGNNNFDRHGELGVSYRWPVPELITDGLIPRAISKSIKPLEPTAARLGWTCVPVFMFEDDDIYDEFVDDGDLDRSYPEIPEGSDMSTDDEMFSDEDDDIMGLDGENRRGFLDVDRRASICGTRPNPLPQELRDWGVVNRAKGYADSDAEDPSSWYGPERTFHKFTDLPIELRYRIWEVYCPDLTAPARVYEFDVGCFRTLMGPQDFKAYEGAATRCNSQKVRKVLAVNQESRKLVLKALPDTLDFRLPPHGEMMKNGDIADYPTASLRFRKETDVVFLRQPPEWQWGEDIPKAEQAYTLPGFGDVVRNLAVVQPPGVIFRDDYSNDIKHLVDQFPNLVNYYYIVPPGLASAKYMKWTVAPQTTRYSYTRAEQTVFNILPTERELWCWVTQDATAQVRIPPRVAEQVCRLEKIAKDKGLNLLPMTYFRGRADYETYVKIVEEDEKSRLKAAKGEPEEPDSDEDGSHDNEQIPIETLIGAIMDGSIPGGMPMLEGLLEHAGIDPHALDDAYEAFQQQVHYEWDDPDEFDSDDEMMMM